jgi:hypothetical protein
MNANVCKASVIQVAFPFVRRCIRKTSDSNGDASAWSQCAPDLLETSYRIWPKMVAFTLHKYSHLLPGVADKAIRKLNNTFQDIEKDRVDR